MLQSESGSFFFSCLPSRDQSDSLEGLLSRSRSGILRSRSNFLSLSLSGFALVWVLFDFSSPSLEIEFKVVHLFHKQLYKKLQNTIL